MIKYILLFIVFCVFIFFAYHVIKFSNPYKLYILFGKKGSGKSTFICKMAHRYLKQGRPVFTNIEIPGCYGFDAKKFGQIMFPPESVIFIDEIGLIFDNRNHKDFSDDAKAWLRLQRHYRNTLYVFSQNLDMDKKIRDQADFLFMVTNFMNCISVARKINRRLCIVHADTGGTGESHIADDLDFTPWFTIPFGGAIFTFIPRWVKYFNSFDAPELPIKEFIYYDERTDLNHVTVFDHLRCFILSCWSRFTCTKIYKVFKTKKSG